MNRNRNKETKQSNKIIEKTRNRKNKGNKITKRNRTNQNQIEQLKNNRRTKMAKEFDIKLIKESKKSIFSIEDSIISETIQPIDSSVRGKCIAHIISLLLS